MLFTIKKKITRNERLIGLMVSYVLRPAGVSSSRMEPGGGYVPCVRNGDSIEGVQTLDSELSLNHACACAY